MGKNLLKKSQKWKIEGNDDNIKNVLYEGADFLQYDDVIVT